MKSTCRNTKSTQICRSDPQASFPIAMAYVPWQQWQTPYGPERGLAQGTIFSELDLAFDKGRCS